MTHKLVSEMTTTSFYDKLESIKAMFKVVNSRMNLAIGAICSTPLKVRHSFGRLDLMVVPLDDHSIIFG